MVINFFVQLMGTPNLVKMIEKGKTKSLRLSGLRAK